MPSHPTRVLALLALTLGCSSKPTVAAKAPVIDMPLPIACRGDGRPPVILEAGLGNDASVWSAVVPGVAQTTRVCAYDRAGLGASKRPAPRPHSNEMMARELHASLRAAGVPEPYVLVGHSMGGANIRYLAGESPQAVSGMVLVDSVGERQPCGYWALLPAATLAEFKAGLRRLPEGLDFDTLCDGFQRLGTVNPSLGKIPLVVLSRGKELPPPPGVSTDGGKEIEAAWRGMQEALPRLSSNSAHVVVEDAGHFIQLDRPEVVVAAIREVVAAVRETRPINAAGIAGAVN